LRLLTVFELAGDFLSSFVFPPRDAFLNYGKRIGLFGKTQQKEYS
jgi:hypothetical protein